MEPYQYPCGHFSYDTSDEQWKNPISCQIVGCKGCRYTNGTIYYAQDARKALAMWAKHERKRLYGGQNE